MHEEMKSDSPKRPKSCDHKKTIEIIPENVAKPKCKAKIEKDQKQYKDNEGNDVRDKTRHHIRQLVQCFKVNQLNFSQSILYGAFKKRLDQF